LYADKHSTVEKELKDIIEISSEYSVNILCEYFEHCKRKKIYFSQKFSVSYPCKLKILIDRTAVKTKLFNTLTFN